MGTELDETRMQRYAREGREEKEWEVNRLQRRKDAVKDLSPCKCGGEIVIASDDDSESYYAMCPDCFKTACQGSTPEQAAQNWRDEYE